MVYVWMWLILTGALITAGPDIPDPCKTPEHAEDPNIFSISLICIARVGAIFVRAYKTLHKLGGGRADMGQRARCLAINILSHILARMPQKPPTESCTGVWGIASLDLKTDEKSYIQITVYDICMQDSYVQLVKTSTTTRSRPCAGGRPPPPPSSLPHPSRAQPQVAPQTACHSEWCCPDVT